MNEKITLKNKSFAKMFSFLVVLVMVAFSSYTAFAQPIQVRLNLTPDRVYNGSAYGGLDWKNITAKLVNNATGAEIPTALCDVNAAFDPQTVTSCVYSDKNAGKNKSCEVSELSIFSTVTLTNPSAYVLVPITAYAPVSYSKLSYDPTGGGKLVSTKGEIKHAYLNASYSIPTVITRPYNGSDLLNGSPIELSSIALTGYVPGESGCYVSEITNVFAPSANAGFYNIPDAPGVPGNQATVNGIRIDGPGSIAYNYKINAFKINARILPKPITVNEDAIAILDHQYDGTNVATIDWTNTTIDPSILFSGVIAGDIIDLDRTLGTATFSDSAVASMKNVSIAGLALDSTGVYFNYTLAPNTALSHGNITKANLDPSLALTAASVFYGTKLVDIVNTTITPAPLGFDYRIEWLYDGVDSNNYQPLVSESGSALIQARLIKLESTFPSNDDQNFNSLVVPANVTITPKPIFVDLIGAEDKVYDGGSLTVVNTLSATYNNEPDLLEVTVSRNGILDDIAIDYSTYIANFADVNVGAAKTVNFTGAPTESGLSLPNYSITYITSSFASITKAPFITMKLKNSVTFPPIDYPVSFSSSPLLADFDFTGFIGTDEASFGVNFTAEDFRYRLTDNSLPANYISIVSPQPNTYKVVVTKASDSPALSDSSTITIIDAANTAIIANYEGIQFLTSDRDQLVNITPAAVIFPAQNITEYGWTLKEIYSSVDASGVQIIDAAANLDPTMIRAQAGPLFIEGVFEWVFPDTIPNVTANPGEPVDYIFTPDAALYGTAYGVTITGTHHVLLSKAQLAISNAPTTQTIFVNQTVGTATITAPSGEVIHKNKLSTVYSTTVNPLIGDWSYINPAEVILSTGTFAKHIQFSLTDLNFLRNYISPVLLTDLGDTATATINVSPSVDNFNPDGVSYEFVYGTKISDIAALPIIDTLVFVIPGKELAFPGTFTFITDDASLTPMNVNTIPYRTFAPDTTLWVLYTPGDSSYAPEAFLAKVKVTPKTLYYDVTYTKLYDGIANIKINTSNADLNPIGQIVDRLGIFDDVTFDSITFDLVSKNVNTYDQTDIIASSVIGKLIGADNYNYVLAALPTVANVTITPIPLTVNIDNETISIREVLPTFNVVWSGFVNGEDFSSAITDHGQDLFVAYGLTHVTTGQFAPTTSTEWIQIPVGKYTANFGNYTITPLLYGVSPVGTELNNILVINPAQIKIIAQDRQRVYGEITNPPYVFDISEEAPNPLYYDFDVYEYRSATDSVLIAEAEKNSMFLQTPTISCDSNKFHLQVGTYIINKASNTQLKLDTYGNEIYEILDHVTGILTVNKVTPKVMTLPTTQATTFGGKLSQIALVAGSAVHPFLSSEFAPIGHFEWAIDPDFVPAAGPISYPVKYVVDDSRNFNNAIINNQYFDVDSGYYNSTLLSEDPLSGATFEASITINQVLPVIIWPTSSLLSYGQTLSQATLNNGSTYNPIDVNPAFTWTIARPDTVHPFAGITMYEVLYTPSNANYLGHSTSIPVYTNKTTPTLVSGSVVVASYEFGQTLSENPITASFINTFNNETVVGTIDWVNGTLTPVDGLVYNARFTPIDHENYNLKLITIQVQVTPVTPVISNWPAVSSLVYGQKIEDANISGGLAINPNNTSKVINGSFGWTTPSTLAVTGTSPYNMTFTPTDLTKYLPVSANVSVYTEKATPIINLDDVTTDVYGKTLFDRPLVVVSAENIVSHIGSTETLVVGGAINWNNATTIPTVNRDLYPATFIPTQSGDYNSVEIYVSVITTKADPIMNPYSVSTYDNGQKLNVNSISLSPIPAHNQINNSDIDGTITWNSPDVTPVNGTSYLATFRPEDQVNYNTVTLSIPVTVLSEKPIISWPTVSSLTYGQNVIDAVLTGGSAVNPNDNRMAVAVNFVWETPNALPVVGIASYKMICIPTDITMLPDTTSIQITTVKATPVVTITSFVADDLYGKTLAQRGLPTADAHNVINHKTGTINSPVTNGVITWASSTIRPTVNQEIYFVTYTPADQANYNTVYNIPVSVITTKTTPDVTLAPFNAYFYGQTLSTQVLQIATEQNTSLAPAFAITPTGTVAWNEPNTIPTNSTTHQVNYTPNDVDNYNSLVIDVTVTVNASTPVVTFPIASNLTYGQLLEDADLTIGSANNMYNSQSVAGTFSFVTPTTLPSAAINNGNSANQVIFTPSDLTKYNTLTGAVNVFTAKATPVVTVNVLATDTYGKTLLQRNASPSATAKNIISHRSAVVEDVLTGSVVWNAPNTIPTVAQDSYTATYSVTGANAANYNTVVVDVVVPTIKATPVINTPTVDNYTYGQALPAKAIAVASVVNPNNSSLVLTGGTIAWNSIDVLPVTGTNVHTATYTPSGSDLANYNTVDFGVSVIVNKANPVVTWPLATELIYGQPLSLVALTGSHFAVNTNSINNVDVPGTFVWDSPTSVIPANPATSYKLRFIPSDLVNYHADSTMINLVVNKAYPSVVNGTFTEITYGESLADVVISNETVTNPYTQAIVAGNFAWVDNTIVPNVNNAGFVRVFTPNDQNNYLIVETAPQAVVVRKANPVLTQTTNPFIITYGQPLPAITATAVNPNSNAAVNGTYVWNNDVTNLIPQAGDAAPFQVQFTPAQGIDAENYNSVLVSFDVKVNKAKPVVTAPNATSLVYEQTLAESLLSGGTSMNPYIHDRSVAGEFVWTLSTTIPDAGSFTYPAIFIPEDNNNYDNSDPIGVVVEVAKKHIDIEIYNLVHIFDGNQKEASFRDAEGRIDLTGMVDADYYKGNTNVLITSIAPIDAGTYRVIATIIPTSNYEGCDTAMLIINKNASNMTNPEDEIEIVNAIVPGKNQYFKIRDCDQMTPVTVRMVNANGNNVYTSDNYNNDFNMSNLPRGTYFYAITFKLNGTEYNKTGRVEVVGK